MKEHIFLIIGMIALTDVCDTCAQLILKSSINSLGWQVSSVKKSLSLILQLLKIPRVWFGFLLSGFSLLFWLAVLARTDLNLAFSIDSMRYILIALASVLFLKEKVSLRRWLGIACVVCGIVFVVLG